MPLKTPCKKNRTNSSANSIELGHRKVILFIIVILTNETLIISPSKLVYFQNAGRTRWVRWWPGTRRCSAALWATPRNTSDSTGTVYRLARRTDRPGYTRNQSWTWRARARRRRSLATTELRLPIPMSRSDRRVKRITPRSIAISATRSRWRTRISVVLVSRCRRAAKRAIRATDAASPSRTSRESIHRFAFSTSWPRCFDGVYTERDRTHGCEYTECPTQLEQATALKG